MLPTSDLVTKWKECYSDPVQHQQVPLLARTKTAKQAYEKSELLPSRVRRLHTPQTYTSVNNSFCPQKTCNK